MSIQSTEQVSDFEAQAKDALVARLEAIPEADRRDLLDGIRSGRVSIRSTALKAFRQGAELANQPPPGRDEVLAAYAELTAVKQELVADVLQLADALTRCAAAASPEDPWTTKDQALAALQAPIEKYRTAEAVLREAASALDGDGGVPSADSPFGRALVAYFEAVKDLAEGVRTGGGLWFAWASESTKKQIKENLATYAPEVSNALIVTKSCLFIALNVMGALTPVFPPLGAIAAVIGLASNAIIAIAVDAYASSEAEKEDVVLDHVGKRYADSEVSGALKKGAGYADKVQTASDLTGAMEHLGKVGEVGGPVTGPVISTLGLAIDLFEADPGELRQTVPANEIEPLRSAARMALKARGREDHQPGDVLVHTEPGPEGVLMTIRGEDGWMKDGRFSPINRTFSFETALEHAQKNPPPGLDLRWDSLERGAWHSGTEGGGWFDITIEAYSDVPAPGYEAFAGYFRLPGRLIAEGEVKGLKVTDLDPFNAIASQSYQTKVRARETAPKTPTLAWSAGCAAERLGKLFNANPDQRLSYRNPYWDLTYIVDHGEMNALHKRGDYQPDDFQSWFQDAARQAEKL